MTKHPLERQHTRSCAYGHAGSRMSQLVRSQTGNARYGRGPVEPIAAHAANAQHFAACRGKQNLVSFARPAPRLDRTCQEFRECYRSPLMALRSRPRQHTVHVGDGLINLKPASPCVDAPDLQRRQQNTPEQLPTSPSTGPLSAAIRVLLYLMRFAPFNYRGLPSSAERRRQSATSMQQPGYHSQDSRVS